MWEVFEIPFHRPQPRKSIKALVEGTNSRAVPLPYSLSMTFLQSESLFLAYLHTHLFSNAPFFSSKFVIHNPLNFFGLQTSNQLKPSELSHKTLNCLTYRDVNTYHFITNFWKKIIYKYRLKIAKKLSFNSWTNTKF